MYMYKIKIKNKPDGSPPPRVSSGKAQISFMPPQVSSRTPWVCFMPPIVRGYRSSLFGHTSPEMEKAADAVDAVRAIFFYMHAIFFSPRVFHGCLPFLFNFWHFCSLLNGFDHFLHIFCVLIFQAPSCARAFYTLFPSLYVPR